MPPESACTENLCFHWVTSTEDAPPLADGDGDQIPDWVAVTAGEFEYVWQRIVGDLGYRPPLPDGNAVEPGPDERTDIYLADLGSSSAYGYCTTDDFSDRWDLAAYCVVDNDFAPEQYGAPALQSLQATAAHEFFHAVQSGYDFLEDRWMMESTAAWMEEQVYPDADDNLQFLGSSALSRPYVPLDHGQDGFEYGNFIFWSFLAEYLTDGRPDPAVVREVWQLADARAGAPDLYSIQAVSRVAARHGLSFARTFADFGVWNRFARDWYADGATYPQNALAARFSLSRRASGTGWQRQTLHHLTNTHVAFRPGRTLRGTWRLRIDLDLPKRVRGSVATVGVQFRDGHVRWLDLRLSNGGDASVAVPFSRGRVSSVLLTLTNASTRYSCGTGTPMSCFGYSLDDRLPYWFRARLVR